MLFFFLIFFSFIKADLDLASQLPDAGNLVNVSTARRDLHEKKEPDAIELKIQQEDFSSENIQENIEKKAPEPEKKEVVEAKTEKEEKIEKLTEELVEKIKKEIDQDDKDNKSQKKDSVEIGKFKKDEKKQKKPNEQKKIITKKFETKSINSVTLETKNDFFGKTLPENYPIINKENEIHIGLSTSSAGGLYLISKDIIYGFNLIFNKVNRVGGIKKQDKKALIRFYTLNDKNEVKAFKKNINTMSKRSPLFIGMMGPDSISSLKKEFVNKEIASFFAIDFPAFFKDKISDKEPEEIKDIYNINFRASRKHEIAGLISYAIKQEYKTKFAIFYEQSLFGESTKNTAIEILKEFGIKDVFTATYPKNRVGIMPAVRKIAAAQPDVVLCLSHARPGYNFIQQLLNQNMENCLFLGLGEMFPIQKILKSSRGVNLILSSVVPNPFKSKLEIVEQYRKDMKSFFKTRDLSVFSLESYISASIFIQAIASLDQPITISALFDYFKKLKNVDFGGIKLDYQPEQNSLSQIIWINQGPDKDWQSFSLKN